MGCKVFSVKSALGRLDWRVSSSLINHVRAPKSPAGPLQHALAPALSPATPSAPVRARARHCVFEAPC